MPTKRTEAQRRAERRYHHRNSATRRADNLRRYRGKREYIIAYKQTHPCIDCAETDVRCLTFDHRDPAEKKYTIASMAANGSPLLTIIAEIAKCDVRCANCHAKRHYDNPVVGPRLGGRPRKYSDEDNALLRRASVSSNSALLAA